MTKGRERHRSPLKPKYGLNGPPKAFVGVVISLLTRLRESAAQDDGFVGVLKNLLVGCVKTIKIKKVTTSRDDKLESGASMGNSLVAERLAGGRILRIICGSIRPR